jgi:hypothetical protein
MRTPLLIAILMLTLTSARADQFYDGFVRGYIAGYKRAWGSSFDPITPFCPLQPIKRFNDPDSDFEQGYIIGLERGMRESSRR